MDANALDVDFVRFVFVPKRRPQTGHQTLKGGGPIFFVTQ
jgi:hypothetical protein